MTTFRALLNPRMIRGDVRQPHEHNPTALKCNVISHHAEYTEFLADPDGVLGGKDDDGKLLVEPGKPMPATSELCGKIRDAVREKYGQDLVEFQAVISPERLAAEQEELAEYRAAKDSGELGGLNKAERQDLADMRAAMWPVNANTATLAQLLIVPGIGKQSADAILLWRQENGRFSSLEQVAALTPKKNDVASLAEFVAV